MGLWLLDWLHWFDGENHALGEGGLPLCWLRLIG